MSFYCLFKYLRCFGTFNSAPYVCIKLLRKPVSIISDTFHFLSIVLTLTVVSAILDITMHHLVSQFTVLYFATTADIKTPSNLTLFTIIHTEMLNKKLHNLHKKQPTCKLHAVQAKK